jgi:hypothetical protein
MERPFRARAGDRFSPRRNGHGAEIERSGAADGDKARYFIKSKKSSTVPYAVANFLLRRQRIFWNDEPRAFHLLPEYAIASTYGITSPSFS